MINLSLIKTEDVSTHIRSCGKGQGKGISSLYGLQRKFCCAFYNDALAAKHATGSRKRVIE
jgi:hypothetical protein